MGFPVDIRKITPQLKRDFNWIINNSNRFYYNSSSAGGYSSSGTNVSTPNWRGAAKPTVTANVCVVMAIGVLSPKAGRCYYITKLNIATTDKCDIIVRIQKRTSPYSNAGDASMSIAGTFKEYILHQNNDLGGEVSLDLVSNPLKMVYGDEAMIYYTVNSTTGTNWAISVDGYDCTNDENYSAPYMYGILGDSISITSDSKELEYIDSDVSGNLHGMWSYIVANYLKSNGIDCLLSNRGLGGTNTPQWESMVAMGLFQHWRPDILSINLGMNDAGSIGFISTTQDVDGIFKKSYKNIIKRYFDVVPDGCCIVNQVTDSDNGSRVAVISSGIYAGKKQIEAIRLEVIALVSELQILYPNWDLHLADTFCYLATEKNNYVTGEQSSAASIHPNCRIAQPKMANRIISVLQNSVFFSRNKL